MTADTLDRAGDNRPTVVQPHAVAELTKATGQAAATAVDSLAPGSRQMLPLSPADHLHGSMGNLTCEKHGKTIAGPCSSISGAQFTEGETGSPDPLGDIPEAQQDTDPDTATANLTTDQNELAADTVDQHHPRLASFT
ncbi:hypothetical protein [Streptomyces sp. NPDC091217]|uniref:hypothetical protein n=1 Tax=Streptomyces sp. NPDC091217 TaxID=3365975 RepID=UPI00382F7E39